MLKLVKAKINRPKKKHEWLKQGGHARLPFEKFITKLKGKIKVVVFLIRQKKKKIVKTWRPCIRKNLLL